jgi:predicted phage terminase large subunit-like protein
MDFNLLLRAKPYVAQHLKKDFAAFVRGAWPHLHPGSKLSWTTAHDLICEYLVAVYRGDKRRLIVNCPPRFSKSTIVNVCWPVWVWLQDPQKSFLCCSYEIDLALNMNLDRRRLMDSKWFRDLFADCFQLASDRSQAGDFSNTAGGQMQAASVNSKAQGRGGDFVVVDDPLSADFAYSESFRNETNTWFAAQLPQRLNDPSNSAIVVIMQRLHQNDPTGFLLSQEDSEWTLLKLPLVCEQDETITFPISGRVWKRKKGDCLDSRRWSARTVKERQRNRLVWAGQFQQEPAPTEGNLIRADDILYFGGRDPQTGAMDPGLPESFERKIISVDCSFKDKATSDFVAVVVVGVAGSCRYLLHVTNAHLDLTGTENEIRNCRAAFSPVSATLVEDKANGSSVIAHLKEEIPGLIAVDPQGGKVSRVVAASPEFQAHNWIIDRNGPWTSRVVQQLVLFPNAKNDDICDAITQASIWLQANTYELGWIDYLKKIGQDIARGLRHPDGSPKQEPTLPLPHASSKPATEKFPSCPKCRVELRPFGSTPPADLRCPNCARTYMRDGTLVSKPEQSDACPNYPGPHDFRAVSVVPRCMHCGLQRGGNEPTNGMTRAQYESGSYRRRRFG